MRERATAWLAWFGVGRLVLTAVCVLAIAAGGYWLVRTPAPPVETTLPSAGATATSPPATLVPPTSADTAIETGADEADPTPVVVHVAGQVRSPGVYELSGSRRVHDAIERAGGATDEADLDALNLAQQLFDGQRLYVPALGEVDASSRPAISPAAPLIEDPAGSSGGSGGSGGVVGAGDGPIDLNRATEAELDTLPGVGPSTARAIVEDRERNGPFASVDDLDRVAGIGPSKLARLRELVTV